MPMLMAGLEEPIATSLPQHQSYPAQTKSANGSVNSISTEITTTLFSDKIVVTVSQDGRLGQWFQVVLSPRDASTFTGLPQPDTGTYHESLADDDDAITADDSMLPLPHLTARTLLGASTAERETTGQLYATQIASAIMARRPDETRVLLVGLGLEKAFLSGSSGRGHGADNDATRAGFFDLLELVVQTL